ncbi:hypothetical protein Ctob_015639 [Chrysochromulina tobinii]|uniref:Uncharacterized protein n=1 Tax=Chrysochromulina tobinii TaxID=1460289 RepID=A0A0M0LS30_9EUKA|nr:hypothetical protein Ctob_015639 [Chrysochromulina tobinii]|eukprot:KOO53791.1 hypothetical protein Ctob_015639 [Chrysochromulina sp. CCMP291]
MALVRHTDARPGHPSAFRFEDTFRGEKRRALCLAGGLVEVLMSGSEQPADGGGSSKPAAQRQGGSGYAELPGHFHDGLGRGVATTFLFGGYPAFPPTSKPTGGCAGTDGSAGGAAQLSKGSLADIGATEDEIKRRAAEEQAVKSANERANQAALELMLMEEKDPKAKQPASSAKAGGKQSKKQTTKTTKAAAKDKSSGVAAGTFLLSSSSSGADERVVVVVVQSSTFDGFVGFVGAGRADGFGGFVGFGSPASGAAGALRRRRVGHQASRGGRGGSQYVHGER